MSSCGFCSRRLASVRSLLASFSMVFQSLSFSSGTGFVSAGGGGGVAAAPGVHSDAPALKLKLAALGFIVLLCALP